MDFCAFELDGKETTLRKEENVEAIREGGAKAEGLRQSTHPLRAGGQPLGQLTARVLLATSYLYLSGLL